MTTLSPAAEKIIQEKKEIRGPLEEVFRRVYSKNARLLTRKPNPAEPEEVRGVDLYIPAPVSLPSYTEDRLRGSPPRIPPSGNGLLFLRFLSPPRRTPSGFTRTKD